MDTLGIPRRCTVGRKGCACESGGQSGYPYIYGRIASGDQFISSQEVKERIVTLFGAKCAEMEGAAIAHGAYLNQISMRDRACNFR